MSWIPTATLFVMMLSLGMTLRPEDFRRLLATPSAVAVGVIGQIVLLPLVAFGLARALDLSPTMSIGLVLISACPGGVISNTLTHLARGDVALAISMSAMTSLVTFLSLPFVISVAMRAFGTEGPPIVLSITEMVTTLFGTTALPVLLGMLLLHLRPALAGRLYRPLLAASTSVLMLAIAGLFVGLASAADELSIATLFRRVTPAVVALVASTMAMGFASARLLGLGEATARTLAIEIGIQNINLALVVATSFLGEQRYAGPAVVYLPVSFAFAGVVVAMGRSARNAPSAAPQLSR
jgi:bile acid:Na+ symporter, BASS family